MNQVSRSFALVVPWLEEPLHEICYLPAEWLQEIDYRPLALAGAPAWWSYGVLQDILHELRDGARYRVDIPEEALSYRIACLMCLFPTYQTILTAAQRQPRLFTVDHQIKISRETMAQCVQEAVSLAPNDEAILSRSQRLEDAIQSACHQGPDSPIFTPAGRGEKVCGSAYGAI
jgi:hypothetical protein